MKRLISVLITICLVMSTALTAFAAEEITSEEVKNELSATVGYLEDNGIMFKASYTLDDALDLYYLLKTDMSVKNADSFVVAVKENLKANNGKLVSSNGETMTTYCAAIQILYCLDQDPTDIDGVDLYKALSALDPTVMPLSPYEYNVIVPVAAFVDDVAFGEAVVNTLLDNYYVKGQGMNYYGFGCDNTAYLISALSGYINPDNDELSEKCQLVIDDCLDVLKSYKVDGGYCYSPEYGTDPNGNSTAAALMAYSALYFSVFDGFDAAVCSAAYADLLTFKGTASGAYTYMKDGDNAFATADAMRALSVYYSALSLSEPIEPDEDYDPNEENTGDFDDDKIVSGSLTEAVDDGVDTIMKSPDTGVDITTATFSVAFCTAAIAAIIARKKDK